MMKAFIIERYGSADRVRAGEMPDPELREDDVLVQIHAAGVNLWIPKSETASSSAFCRIACRSFWAMTSPGSWSASDLECVDSSSATKSMRGRLTGESVHSRNSVRSKKMTWRSSPKHSPWKKRLPSP